jgi:hypothetical protein
MTMFRDLPIGQTFDFIGPFGHANSFYARCVKVSNRKYAEVARPEVVYTVGTIKVQVYHVGEEV